MVEEVVGRIKNQQSPQEDKKWVDASIAMGQLGISSSTTLQKLRDEGKIRFTQPSRKIILYDRHSIESYLEKHAKDTF